MSDIIQESSLRIKLEELQEADDLSNNLTTELDRYDRTHFIAAGGYKQRKSFTGAIAQPSA